MSRVTRPPKREAATLLELSAATRSVVSKAGVSFVRGREAFTLNDAELDRLLLGAQELMGASVPASDGLDAAEAGSARLEA